MRDGSIREIRNVSTNSHREFQMDRRQLSEVNPKDVVALWHSHPGGTLYPSSIDQKNMTELGEAYGDWLYLIVTKDDVVQYNTGMNWNDFSCTAS